MALDPILTEVRQIREHYAEQFHGDVRAMMDDLRRRHAQSGQGNCKVNGSKETAVGDRSRNG